MKVLPPNRKSLLCAESVLSPGEGPGWRIGGEHEASEGRGERFSDLQAETSQRRENKTRLPHVSVSTREKGKKATSSSYASLLVWIIHPEFIMHDQSYESYPACRSLTFIYLVGWRCTEPLLLCSFYALLTQVSSCRFLALFKKWKKRTCMFYILCNPWTLFYWKVSGDLVLFGIVLLISTTCFINQADANTLDLLSKLRSIWEDELIWAHLDQSESLNYQRVLPTVQCSSQKLQHWTHSINVLTHFKCVRALF